jgi:hypothetical protein
VEVALDRGQREVENRCVDERDRRPGDGRDQDEAAGADPTDPTGGVLADKRRSRAPRVVGVIRVT